MKELDEISRLLGNIEANIKNLRNDSKVLSEKIDCLERKLFKLRINFAYIVGGVTVVFNLLLFGVKKLFSS